MIKFVKRKVCKVGTLCGVSKQFGRSTIASLERIIIRYENLQKKSDSKRVGFSALYRRTPRQMRASFFVAARSVLVAAHELVHATSGVHQLGFASVERVRRTRNFELHQRISYPIDVDGFFRSHSRTRNEHLFVRHVLECHGTIAFWMNSFFHCVLSIYLTIFQRAKVQLFPYATKFLSKKFFMGQIFADLGTVQ